MAHALEITTEAPERAKVAIDGKAYELANGRDLDIETQCVIMRTLSRSEWLAGENTADATDEQIEMLVRDVHRSAKALLLDCPGEVYDKLTDDDRLQIVLCFAQQPAKKTVSKSRRTSKRSPGSSDSTAAVPVSGQA